MTTLREQLIRFREFDEDQMLECQSKAIYHAKNMDDLFDEGAHWQHAKDQKLFELLTNVAVAAENYYSLGSTGNEFENMWQVLENLKTFVGGDGEEK